MHKKKLTNKPRNKGWVKRCKIVLMAVIWGNDIFNSTFPQPKKKKKAIVC